MTAPETVGTQIFEESIPMELFQAAPDEARTSHPMNTPVIPDELVLRAQDGCVDAQTETIALAQPMALRIARGFSRIPQQVEDVASDGITKVYEKGLLERQYLAPGNFDAWTKKVVHRVGLDHYRRSKRIGFVSVAPDEQYFWDTHLPQGESAYHSERGTDDPGVQAILAIAGVHNIYAESFVLHKVDGYSYEEISRMLSINIGTVRSRIGRAKKQLQRKTDQIEEALEIRISTGTA